MHSHLLLHLPRKRDDFIVWDTDDMHDTPTLLNDTAFCILIAFFTYFLHPDTCDILDSVLNTIVKAS
jgi:hypothetical protein